MFALRANHLQLMIPERQMMPKMVNSPNNFAVSSNSHLKVQKRDENLQPYFIGSMKVARKKKKKGQTQMLT